VKIFFKCFRENDNCFAFWTFVRCFIEIIINIVEVVQLLNTIDTSSWDEGGRNFLYFIIGALSIASLIIVMIMFKICYNNWFGNDNDLRERISYYKKLYRIAMNVWSPVLFVLACIAISEGSGMSTVFFVLTLIDVILTVIIIIIFIAVRYKENQVTPVNTRIINVQETSNQDFQLNNGTTTQQQWTISNHVPNHYPQNQQTGVSSSQITSNLIVIHR